MAGEEQPGPVGRTDTVLSQNMSSQPVSLEQVAVGSQRCLQMSDVV